VAGQDRELIDWDEASVVIEFASNSRLVVSGSTPIPMDVRLEPQNPGVAEPEYRRIDLVGYRREVAPEVITPFETSTELNGVSGRRGVELVGKTKRERFPPRDR